MDAVNEIISWGPENIPDGAWHQAMRIARSTGRTAMIEMLLRDDPFDPR